MPNHCYNYIEFIHHDDPNMIKRLEEYLNREEPVFFAEFVPCPEDEHRVSYWGTKWDVYDCNVDEISENSMSMSFHTAWTPPIAAYEKLTKLGFKISALYVETGCDFCGYWNDGEETVYENASENLSDIPLELREYFCQEDSEEEEEEEEEEEGEDG
jgi:hypothetical protein